MASDWTDLALQTAKPWAAFPVGVHPRPVVLTRSPWLTGGWSGGDAKVGIGERRFDVDPTVDDDAVAAMELAGFKPNTDAAAYFRVTAAQRSTARFNTDRGQRVMSSWALTTTNMIGPCHVLDFEAWTTLWDGPGEQAPVFPSYSAADVSPDGRSVRLLPEPHFPPGPSASTVEAPVWEFDTVVVVAPPPFEQPDEPETLMIQMDTRAWGFTLREPLGDRVMCIVGDDVVTVESHKRRRLPAAP